MISLQTGRVLTEEGVETMSHWVEQTYMNRWPEQYSEAAVSAEDVAVVEAAAEVAVA